jgi:predicted CXXCH cytochrome family protein
VALALLVVGALGLVGLRAARDLEPRPPSELPEDLAGTDGFASSSRCQACHPGEYASWWESYHRRMTEPARPESFASSFEAEELRWEGRTYRVLRKDGVPHVDMPAFGTTGGPGDRWVLPVVMLTGSHNLQAYWIRPPLPPPPEGAHAAWKRACARCHDKGEAPDLDDEGWSADEVRGSFRDAHRVRVRPLERAPAGDAGIVLELTEDGDEPVDVEVDSASDAELGLAFAIRGQFAGRLAQFPFVYSVENKRWLHEESSFLQPVPEAEPVEPWGDRWSYGCDGCHATAPTYDLNRASAEVESGAVDLGIACESCHGPGEAHADRHRSPLSRWSAGAADIVNPAKLSPDRASMVCGQCHANLEEKPGVTGRFLPGEDLEARARVVQVPEGEPPAWLKKLLDEDEAALTATYWGDGTIRVAGRDYNGLRRSACATKGEMSCLSCHRMHGAPPDDQLAEGMRGDAACTGCHADVDAAAHSHHPASSSGARCMNCHMPHTTYGLLKAIRSHRVDSPTVEMSTKHGRPNACNLCHLDKSLGWTAAKLHEWYEQPAVVVEAGPLLGGAASVAWLLEGDAIVRAITAWHMRWPPALEASGGPEPFAPYLRAAYDDRYTAVRYQIAKSLELDIDFEQRATLPLEVAPELAAALRAAVAERKDPDVSIDE